MLEKRVVIPSNLEQPLSVKPHILVVDDDTRISALVSRYLHEHGLLAMTAENADVASKMLHHFDFDAMVLDVMMPGQDGISFTRDLKAQGVNIPILLLTALGEVENRITGLEAGADDYLPKPFDPQEMVLRLRSILRRSQKTQQHHKKCVKFGPWFFNPDYEEVENQETDTTISLTSVEAKLLRALMENVGEVMSRDDLAVRCDMDAAERTIDVQITRLRRKLEENTKIPRYIQTLRGRGYMLRAEVIDR